MTIRRELESECFATRKGGRGMMTSESGPSQRMMNQYGALSRSPRPDGIPEEAAEHFGNDRSYYMAPTNQASFPTNQAISPAGRADSYFSGQRPRTQDGMSPNGNLVLRSTMTHPISPPTPDRPSWPPEQDQQRVSPPPNVNRNENRVSLTGANLQNRLNHPVPPIPNNESPSRSYTPTQNYAQPVQPSYNHVVVDDRRYSSHMAPSTPTVEQMARLSRRHSPLPTPLQAGPPNQGFSGGHMHRNTASRDFGMAPPSPHRAAWGAAGVPGSPSFNRAIASPNGLSRPNSRGSNRAPVQASQSTPNLLAPMQGQAGFRHSLRPSYSRLDTINSVNSALLPHERAHSVAGGDMNFHGGRMVTDPALAMDGKKAKKNKKKKDDGSTMGKEKGRRCVVM